MNRRPTTLSRDLARRKRAAPPPPPQPQPDPSDAAARQAATVALAEHDRLVAQVAYDAAAKVYAQAGFDAAIAHYRVAGEPVIVRRVMRDEQGRITGTVETLEAPRTVE